MMLGLLVHALESKWTGLYSSSFQFPHLFMGATPILHRIAVRGRDQVSNENNCVLFSLAQPMTDSLPNADSGI